MPWRERIIKTGTKNPITLYTINTETVKRMTVRLWGAFPTSPDAHNTLPVKHSKATRHIAHQSTHGYERRNTLTPPRSSYSRIDARPLVRQRQLPTMIVTEEVH